MDKNNETETKTQNKNDKKFLRIGVVVFCVVCQLLCVYVGFAFSTYRRAPLTNKTLRERGADSCDKLMIVAHPDDDSIWGGGHLMDGGYFIVCVTNGNNAVRKKEFETMLEVSGNKGVILSHPDKTFGKKDNWKKSRRFIKRDLETVIGYKDWDLIVTHNKEGEYGHIHHKMTHETVVDVYNDKKPKGELWFFGKYYTKSKIGDAEAGLERMSDERIAFKEKLEKIYKSQESTVAMFDQMNPFEEWTCYNTQGE